MLWTNVTVKLGDLQPWEHNPRVMTNRQAQRLIKSWQTLGQFQTIAIGPAGEVYDGHQRLNALLAAYGAAYEVEARQSERALNDDERAALTLAANIPAGAWDWDKLAQWDLSEIKDWGMDADTLKTWNADAAALATMLQVDEQQGRADADPQIDRAAELNEKWQVKTGDLWRIGEHRLLCGDSTKREDVERVMMGEKAQMIFTDPPYGVDYDGGTTVREKLAGDSTTDLYMPCCQMSADYSDDRAALYLWHAGIKGIAAAAAAAAAGYEIRCEIVWNKNQAQYGALSAQYKQKHEPCYYCYKHGKTARWFGPTTEITVWDIDRSSVNEFHPTQKPIQLAERAIKNNSEVDNIVSDWFAGSGSTIVACQNLQRKCRAIEISPNYCAVILERMATAFPGIEIEQIE